MKTKNVFWGLFFIVAAGVIVLNQLGYLVGVSLFSLICTIILVPIIIKSAMHLQFSGILIPFALLGIIYAEPLGITALTPWPLLAIAIFLSIGLSLIFHKRWDCENGICYWNMEDKVVNDPDADVVKCSTTFGSSIKYVNSEDFRKGYFKASFGALKIYFQNAKITKGEAEIYLDISFAGTEIYLPKEWKIVNSTDCSFGGIEEKNARIANEDGPVVYLKGKVSFAGIEIIYV